MMPEEAMNEFAHEGSHHTNGAQISLHDLLGRGTEIHWDEAVAIVQAMCEVLLAGGGDTAAVPALTDIVIGREGTVTVRSNRGEKSPTAAARALHDLLSNADMPVPLRLFVTQSTAPDAHESLRAFAAGLEYFGRPNRSELIREVYKRCAGLNRTAAEPTPARLPAAVQDKKSEKESPTSKDSHHGRALIWAAAGVFIAAGAGAAWGWLSVGSRVTTSGGGKGVLSQASAALSDLANQVRARLEPPVSTNTEPSGEPAATVSRPKPRRRPASTNVAVAEAPLASRRLSIAKPNAWQAPVVAPNVAAPVPVALIEEPAPGETTHLFTRQDADVEPPVLRYPQLTPPAPVSRSREAAVNRVEVIVMPDGTVDRIRFVEGPIRMADVLLVQAVKTWTFTPARKDGEPVRYQTVISWTGAP